MRTGTLRLLDPRTVRRTPADYLAQWGIAQDRNPGRVLAPVRPSSAIERAYRCRLERLVAQMQRSLAYWVRSAYRQNRPEIVKLAVDDSPAAALRAVMRRLASRWQRQFDRLAPELARYFAQAQAQRNDVALRAILRRHGISVEFRMTRAMNDAVQAIVNENVALIRSIPQQQLLAVEGAVMRSVQTGRDLGSLAKELEHSFGVTQRRAALISRDQNAKATGMLQRVRQLETGITEAVWLHSHGGRQPRPTHVAMHGKKYRVADGMYDPHEKRHVLPGELINCRCVAKPVLPALASL